MCCWISSGVRDVSLLTRNCEDFRVLHATNPQHPGILAVYQDRDPCENMSYTAMPGAIKEGQPGQAAPVCFYLCRNRCHPLRLEGSP